MVRGDAQGTEWCGTIQGVIDDTGAGSIQNIGIVPEQRGLGLGTALIEKALAGIREWGAASATLEVTADNAGAVRLYQRLGFRRQRTIYKVVDEVVTRPVPTAAAPVAAASAPAAW